MVTGATITVNSSRNEGQINSESESVKYIKAILETLKQGNKDSEVSRKKTESGLSGLLTASSIAAIVAAITKLGPSAYNAGTQLGGALDENSYVNVLVQDENGNMQEKVAAINKKTGEIVSTLDKRQAAEIGILDETGNIKDQYDNLNSIQKTALEIYAKINDNYVLTYDYTEKGLQKWIESDALDQDIINIKKQIKEKYLQILGGGKGKVVDFRSEGGGVGIDTGSQSVDLKIYDSENSRNMQNVTDILTKNQQSSGNLGLAATISNFFGGGRSGGS